MFSEHQSMVGHFVTKTKIEIESFTWYKWSGQPTIGLKQFKLYGICPTMSDRRCSVMTQSLVEN